MSEEDAKKKWLASLDAPSWGQAVTAEMTAACDAGDEVACDELSREEEAKRAWLARLEVPTWGPKAMSEEEAKKAWLARLDVPSWGEAAAHASPASAAQTAE